MVNTYETSDARDRHVSGSKTFGTRGPQHSSSETRYDGKKQKRSPNTSSPYLSLSYSTSRNSAEIRLDFPAPVLPTTPTLDPPLMDRVRPLSTGGRSSRYRMDMSRIWVSKKGRSKDRRSGNQRRVEHQAGSRQQDSGAKKARK